MRSKLVIIDSIGDGDLSYYLYNTLIVFLALYAFFAPDVYLRYIYHVFSIESAYGNDICQIDSCTSPIKRSMYTILTFGPTRLLARSFRGRFQGPNGSQLCCICARLSQGKSFMDDGCL